jgi:7-cyano-7-deazaguanine reductase
VPYCDRYDPTLLFPVARATKRAEIGVDTGALPFHGEDLWNAWELSWLNPRGKPVVAIGEFRVPAISPNLIESKSLKLYLNSFNQTAFASADEVARRIASDLSQSAGAPVAVKLQTLDGETTRPVGSPDGVLIDQLDLDIEDHDGPAPHALTADLAGPVVEETLYSHLLKSNCLVTGQPDWGMLVVRYRGRPIDRAGLLRRVLPPPPRVPRAVRRTRFHGPDAPLRTGTARGLGALHATRRSRHQSLAQQRSEGTAAQSLRSPPVAADT